MTVGLVAHHEESNALIDTRDLETAWASAKPESEPDALRKVQGSHALFTVGHRMAGSRCERGVAGYATTRRAPAECPIPVEQIALAPRARHTTPPSASTAARSTPHQSAAAAPIAINQVSTAVTRFVWSSILLPFSQLGGDVGAELAAATAAHS